VTEHRSAGAADDVEARLRAMGNELVMASSRGDAVAAVLNRIEDEPAPVRTPGFGRVRALAGEVVESVRRQRRLVVALLVAAVVVVLAASPVGAKVREWLGFGAVVVQEQSSAAASDSLTSAAASEGTEIPLEQAADAVQFPIGRPTLLPAPDRVTVSAEGRLITMSWAAGHTSGVAPGEVRLDQVSGLLDPYFFKKYYPEVDFVRVDGIESLWLRQSHPIVVLDPDGTERSESARLSGPALIWQNKGVTLRLEGLTDVPSARAVAESMTY